MSGFTSLKPLRAALGAATVALALAVAVAPASALNIDVVKSPGGIEGWLVQDATVPLVAISFAFRGGASQDPAEKPGVANMMSALLDEGAGPYDSRAFHQKLDERAIEFRFTAGRDYFRGSLRVLNDHRDGAAELLRLMLNEPHFNPPEVERVRRQLYSALLRDTNQPGDMASRAWWSTAFPNHPYGQPVKGTPDSVKAITIDDLKTYRQRVLARDGLKVALIGNITPEAAGKLLDHVFGGLPAKGDLKPVPDITVHGIGQRIMREVDVPQASVVFGGAGIPRHDPDFVAGYVVNHILGGGTFSSRLYNEVREKRGLAYSVHQSLVWLRHTAFAIGGTATQADRAADALGIIEREIKRMREEGPTVDELEKAKAFLKGSYALNFDTSTKIIGQLVQMQIDGLGTDYVNERNKLVEAVTIEDAKRAAHRLYKGGILVTVAGPGALNSAMPARAPGG